MSLHIDFIQPSERHDPLVRIMRTSATSFGVFLAAGCAFYVLFAYLALASARLELSRARARHDSLGANVKLAVSLEGQLEELRFRHGELSAISNSAFHASRQLDAISQVVPADVQLSSLRISSKLIPENDKNERFGRRYQGDVSGCTAAGSAERVVVSMIEKMRSYDDGLLGSVTPGGLNIDPDDPASLLFDVRFDFGFFDCGTLKPVFAKKGGEAR